MVRRGERGRVKALDRHKTISTEEGTYSSPVTSRGRVGWRGGGGDIRMFYKKTLILLFC